MSLYFPTALAMASNNTDVYVGKKWTFYGPEQSGLGQFRVTPVRGLGPGTMRVFSDFAGSGSYTMFGGPGSISMTYNNALRNHVVGTLNWQPGVTTGVEYGAGNTEFVYVQNNAANQAGIMARSLSNNIWYTSTTFTSPPSANYPADMFVHTDLLGGVNRVLLLGAGSGGALYSNTNPSTPFAVTWTSATSFFDGYSKAAFASKPGVTTALGTDGRVRYTTNGVDWFGTTIPGGSSSNFVCATWSSDGNTCIAGGLDGVLAISSDGQNFSIYLGLAGVANWGTRPVRAITSDPVNPSVFYAVSPDGTIAQSNDYGVTWAAGNNLFYVNQRQLDFSESGPFFRPLNQTPLKCWVQSGSLFISIYGGQVMAGSGIGAPYTDYSNLFNNYYSGIGTENYTGNYTPIQAAPTSTRRGVLSGGLGRVRYITSSAPPFGFDIDMSLMSRLIQLGYNNVTVTSAYYDSTLSCTFIGLSNGTFAYRFVDLLISPWSIYTITGAFGSVNGFARLPTGNLIAVTEDGYTAVGTHLFTDVISWAENSNLGSIVYPNKVASVATNGTSIAIAAVEDNVVYHTTDGSTWNGVTLPNPYFGSMNGKIPNVVYDPRASTGFSLGLFLAFYSDFNFSFIAVSSNGTSWSGSVLSFSSAESELPTGTFTFGDPAITIGIKGNGSGIVSVTPYSTSGWGTNPGVTNRDPAFPLPAGNYYPSSPVTFNGGTVTTVDLAVATGPYGRIWLSFNI